MRGGSGEERRVRKGDLSDWVPREWKEGRAAEDGTDREQPSPPSSNNQTEIGSSTNSLSPCCSWAKGEPGFEAEVNVGDAEDGAE
jgi:hypothetical protein